MSDSNPGDGSLPSSNQKKKRKCGICGEPGHDKRSCPQAKSDAGAAQTVKKAKVSGGTARARSPEPSEEDKRKARDDWKDKGLSDGVPNSLVCPFTQSIFQKPVFANDGHTYEEEAMKKYIATRMRDYPGQPIPSPMRCTNLTPGPDAERPFVENQAIKRQLDEFYDDKALNTRRQRVEDSQSGASRPTSAAVESRPTTQTFQELERTRRHVCNARWHAGHS